MFVYLQKQKKDVFVAHEKKKKKKIGEAPV